MSFSRFGRVGHKLSNKNVLLRNVIRKYETSSNQSIFNTVRSHPNQSLKYLGLAGALGLGSVIAYGASRPSTYTPYGTRQTMANIGGQGFASVVRTRIAKTFGYLSASVAITAVSGFLILAKGYGAPLLSMNPIALGIGTLIGVYGCMWACHSSTNPLTQHLAWAGMSVLVGTSLLPISVIAGATIVKEAAMITACIIGGMSSVAMVAPNDGFLKMGPYLGVGLGIVIAASLGGMFFPSSSLLFNVSLYGGLGLFGLMSAYHAQVILHNAQTASYYNPLTEQIGLYFDAVNIFVRVVQILMMSNSRKK